MFKDLSRYVFPQEIVDSFDLVNLQEEGRNIASVFR